MKNTWKAQLARIRVQGKKTGVLLFGANVILNLTFLVNAWINTITFGVIVHTLLLLVSLVFCIMSYEHIKNIRKWMRKP